MELAKARIRSEKNEKIRGRQKNFLIKRIQHVDISKCAVTDHQKAYQLRAGFQFDFVLKHRRFYFS